MDDPNLTPVTLSDAEIKAEQALSGTSLNTAQTTHFHRLRKDEAAELATYDAKSGKGAQEWVRDALKERYGLKNDGEVDTLITDVVQRIKSAPVTLTQYLDQLFGERADKANLPAWGTTYTPELERGLKTKQLSSMLMFDPAKKDGTEVLDREVTLLGMPHKEGIRLRGPNYLRWRREKDEKETGMHQLGLTDMPAFAAVNPTFDRLKGVSANKADWDDTTQSWKAPWGKNYYGDVHMVLKPEVRDRATFISRGAAAVKDRKIERTSLLLLLADMMRIGDWDFVDAFVAVAKGFPVDMLTTMNVEIHIYGGLDLARHVQAIYLQPDAFAATTGAAWRAKEFATANNIQIHSVGTAPTGLSLTKAAPTSQLKEWEQKGTSNPKVVDLRKHF